MSKHFRIECKICWKIIAECRCMNKDKEVRYEVCDECKEKDN